MEYQIKASSVSTKDAILQIKQNDIAFGTTSNSAEILPNPAELFLGAFAACMLKNVERFFCYDEFHLCESRSKCVRYSHGKTCENG